MRTVYYSFIVSLLLIFPMSVANAQTSFYPGESWHICYQTSEGTKTVAAVITYESPAFLANGKEYAPLNIKGTGGNTKYYYRKEDEKIYRYDPSNDTDILMYEFGHSVGDTVTDGDGRKFVVSDVIDAKELTDYSFFNHGEKAYLLIGTEDLSLEDIWIDRVGSVLTGILKRSDFEDGKNPRLSYYTNHDGYYSMVFPLDYPDWKSMPVAKDESTVRFIPKEEREWLENHVKYEFISDTLHVRGIRFGLPDNYDLIYAQTDGDTITVSYREVGLGSLEYENLDDYLFDVKIPRFTPGTYTIRTNKMFVNMPDTVVSCGESISLIGDVNADNTIDISDIVAAINVIVGADSTPGADVNGDGKTDISDIVAIINIIAQ